jgi:hypothetical protein
MPLNRGGKSWKHAVKSWRKKWKTCRKVVAEKVGNLPLNRRAGKSWKLTNKSWGKKLETDQ